MNQRNLRYQISEAGEIKSTPLGEKSRKNAVAKATKLMLEDRNNLFGTVCFLCDSSRKSVFFGWDTDKSKKVIYCHQCGRYYFNSMDITDYEKKNG